MGKPMAKDDDTPVNSALIEYRLAELAKMGESILTKLDEHQLIMSNHFKDDAIVAEQLKQVVEDRKDSRGMWAGVGGAIAGAASAAYAYIKG